MRYLLVFLFFSFSFSSSYSQYNLVPNYSFEDNVHCPKYLDNSLPAPWYIPSDFSDGYFFHSCGLDTVASVPNNYFGGFLSYQPTKTGNGYAAFDATITGYINGRTYVQVKLKDSLIKNARYKCCFWTNLVNPSRRASNNIAMLLTKKTIYVDTVNAIGGIGLIAANPQIISYGNPIITDTLNWVKVSGIYKALGGEQFITIGNFKNDAHTATKTLSPTGSNETGYYIDDVSVIPLDSLPLKADAGKDTTITIGDSAFIGSLTNGIDTIKWLQNGVAVDSVRPGFWVHPLVNTCYILTQTVNGYSSSDTVCVAVNPLPLRFTMFDVRCTMCGDLLPSPLGEGLGVRLLWQTTNEINVSHFNILKSDDGVNFKAIGKVTAQNKTLNSYEFTDPLTTNYSLFTNLYYKIAAVDKDGKMSFSEVKKIRLNQLTNQLINIFPNPAKDFVTIECKGMKEIKVINQLGQVVQQIKNMNQASYNVQLTSYIKGVYIVQVITTNSAVKNAKLIVE